MWTSLITVGKGLLSFLDWKIVVVVLASLGLTYGAYQLVSLQGDVRSLEVELSKTEQELTETKSQAQADLAGYQAEIQAYEDSFETYRISLNEAQNDRAALETELRDAGEDDVDLQECLQRNLPERVLNSLY